MFTFRTSITFTVLAFIIALAALLIGIQFQSLRWATQQGETVRCGWRTLWVLAVCMVEIGRVRVKAGNAPIEQKTYDVMPSAIGRLSAP